MKLPRNLSGQALAAALCRHWRYRIVHQQGSHLIIQTEEPSHQRLSIPAHAVLRIGTLNSILRLIAEHKDVDKQKILDTL